MIFGRHMRMQQGIALTRRNYTGPPCSVGRPTAHAPDGRPTRRQRYRRRQTTDASQQNNTGPLGGPVIMHARRVDRSCQCGRVHNGVYSLL